MALVLTSPPATEPVSVAEAKDHLRVDQVQEDALIASLILTSRLHIETALGLALVDQAWRWTFDAWPKRMRAISLPLRPVSAITEISTRDDEDVVTVMPATDYELDGNTVPPRVIRKVDQWPAPGKKNAGIEISFIAGFGATPDDVPQPIRHALMLLVAHWYEHRDPIEIGSEAAAVPSAVSTLLMPYRAARL